MPPQILIKIVWENGEHSISSCSNHFQTRNNVGAPKGHIEFARLSANHVIHVN